MRLQLSVSLAIAAVLAAAGSARAAEYYVATTGSDSNAGTMAAPWATLQKAANTAVAGDTVWIRGGTYRVTTPANSGAGINFTKSGTSDTNRIKYWAYPGEVPLFDFSGLQISTSGYTIGFVVNGELPALQGSRDLRVPMNTSSNNGISVNGSSAHDIFEQLNLHHNNGNGIFIGNKSGGGHLVLNCDAHDNYDPNSNQGNGQNADGFGVHYQTAGERTIIRGCRAWWNSDDGYDLINQDVSVTVEDSWAMGNGYANYGATNPPDGNGNGFKMGSSPMMVRHLVQNNVAWKNKAAGFYANHSSGGNTWYNNTSFNNGTQYNMLASPPNDPNTTITLTGSLAHIMRNNIGFPNRNTNMTGVDTMFNTWDLAITPANSDFASVIGSQRPPGHMGMSIEASGAIGPRLPDGSMPNIDFLRLAAGSHMIDKGTDVGLPFVGTAPDLGAYEYGAASTTGTRRHDRHRRNHRRGRQRRRRAAAAAAAPRGSAGDGIGRPRRDQRWWRRHGRHRTGGDRRRRNGWNRRFERDRLGRQRRIDWRGGRDRRRRRRPRRERLGRLRLLDRRDRQRHLDLRPGGVRRAVVPGPRPAPSARAGDQTSVNGFCFGFGFGFGRLSRDAQRGGNREEEDGAAPRDALDPDAPAVRLDDSARDR